MLLNGKLTGDGCSWVNIPPPVSFPGAVMNVQPVQDKGGYLGCGVLHQYMVFPPKIVSFSLGSGKGAELPRGYVVGI